MPPIFGIIKTDIHAEAGYDRPLLNLSQSSRLSLLSQVSLKGLAYKTPRITETLATNNSFFSTAICKHFPLQSRDEIMFQRGPVTIIVDASLYKKPDTTTPDIMLILDAWQQWGKYCMKRLYGDFAFVIFNHETGEIFCARDQFGVRPLYYTMYDGLFMFGSELRFILAALPVKPEIRKDYLLDTLVTIKNPKDLTPFPDIFRLKPAHTLTVSNGSAKQECYWQPDPAKKIVLDSANDYVDLFREKLADAVKVRVTGNHVGAELSGGLDSSAITGIASQSGNLTAFSNVFPAGTGIDFKDEKEFMEKMVSFAGIGWFTVDRHSRSIIEILKHSLAIHGTFIQQNFNIFNKSLYEKAADSDIRILLSGFGGDELVSARISLPWNQYIDEGQWSVILDELYYKGYTLKSTLKPVLLAARYLKSRIIRQKYSSGVFTKELLDGRFASLSLNRNFGEANNLRKKLGDSHEKLRKSTLTERQIDRIMMDHLPQRLEYCYTAAAQYGIEYRYPLLDVDLVETALAFPPWVKQHHGINRYLFRESIKGFVPEEIRLRNDKSGSTIPQTFFSLVNEKDEILSVISRASGSSFLKTIFDFSRFPAWYEKLVKRDSADMNYLMPGAFYDYLMILLYYSDLTE